MDKRRLAVLQGTSDLPGRSDEGVPEGLPELWAVLYQRPNLDGSRKACANCMMWVTTKQCVVHGPEIAVEATNVCGHYVHGDPHTGDWADQRNIQYVDPEFSGLKKVPGGVVCDMCWFFDPRGPIDGVCRGARDTETDEYAQVAAHGVCARWTAG